MEGLKYIMVFSAVFSTGLTTVVSSTNAVVAAGQDFLLQCKMRANEHVVQVTWQKIQQYQDQNLATCTMVGRTVNKYALSKIQVHNNATLNNCTIVIKKVSFEDEGCYKCLFIVPGVTSFSQRTTCIQIYDIRDPVIQITNDTVSCSATGRPMPLVVLNATNPSTDYVNLSNIVTLNNDGTFTSTVIMPMQTTHFTKSTQIECTAYVMSHMRKKTTSITVIEDEPKFADEREILIYSTAIITIVVVIICFIMCVYKLTLCTIRRTEIFRHQENAPLRRFPMEEASVRKVITVDQETHDVL